MHSQNLGIGRGSPQIVGECRRQAGVGTVRRNIQGFSTPPLSSDLGDGLEHENF